MHLAPLKTKKPILEKNRFAKCGACFGNPAALLKGQVKACGFASYPFGKFAIIVLIYVTTS